MALLLKGAMLGAAPADIRIEGDRITRIAPELPALAGEEALDCRGLALAPSLANGHAHSAMTLLRGLGSDLSLMEWLSQAMWPREARMDDEDVYWATRLAALEMLGSGTTLCNDMYLHPEAMAWAARDSGMRFVLSYALIDGLDEAVGAVQRRACEAYFDHLPDCGPLSSFSLAAHSVYATCGESLRFLGTMSRERGLPLHVHLGETQTEDSDCRALRGMSPTAWLDSLGALGPLTVAAHCLWLDEVDWDILANRGVALVHNPVSNMKLASGPAFDWERAKSRGLRVLLGTDGAASNNSLDLLSDLKIAGLLQKQHYGDARRLPLGELLQAATWAGHDFFATGAGRVKEGAVADLILLDLDHPAMVPCHDLGSNLVYAGGSAAIRHVLCAGRPVVRDRSQAGASQVLEEVRRRAAGLATLGGA